MSNFEEMEVNVHNKASAKSDRHDTSEANYLSIVGGITRKTLDLRFYDQREFHILSTEDKKTLRDWRASNPEEFGQSKKEF